MSTSNIIELKSSDGETFEVEEAVSTSKIIELKSSDGETFEVEEAVAIQSQLIKHMIEDGCADTSIPLPNVTSKILAMVIEYCKRHVDDASTFDDKIAEDELKNFDTEFLKVDLGTFVELTNASNYLNVKSLQDLACMTLADKMRGKSPEELRKTFNITSDFADEELTDEERREKDWAFEN